MIDNNEVPVDVDGSSSNFEVRIDRFEGTLSGLLDQVKQDVLNILEIPIAHITQEYIRYLDQVRHFSLAVVGEFLVLASTLIYLKAYQLLPMPSSPALRDGEEDCLPDGVNAVADHEYRQLKEIAQQLGEYELRWRELYGHSRQTPHIEAADSAVLEGVSLYDLLKAFQEVLGRASQSHATILRDVWEVKDGIELILERIKIRTSVTFSELFPEDADVLFVIVVFLALLELIRKRRIRALQETIGGPILLSAL